MFNYNIKFLLSIGLFVLVASCNQDENKRPNSNYPNYENENYDGSNFGYKKNYLDGDNQNDEYIPDSDEENKELENRNRQKNWDGSEDINNDESPRPISDQELYFIEQEKKRIGAIEGLAAENKRRRIADIDAPDASDYAEDINNTMPVETNILENNSNKPIQLDIKDNYANLP